MAEQEVLGSSFGQRRPPLTELIASILIRYPDGGQILKELIQNADDAGATEVKFLFDDTTYGKQSLLSSKLDKFQGPALYCYNNAVFSQEDWDGIQNLMRSNKKEDPLKVGRFGIGFNSVYHITDLPGIVSGTTVAFLDPHEIYFGRNESGQRFDIRHGLLRSQFSDQFAPFHDIFGCDLSSEESYTSTLFRFPLRNTPESKLSKTVYNESMIDNLYESMHQEASIILLFLKSVQSISFYKCIGNEQMKCIFAVELSNDTRDQVINEREKLLKQAMQIKSTGDSKCIVGVSISEADKTTIKSEKWLTLNQIGSTNKRILQLQKKLCLIPWIGLAVRIKDGCSAIEDGRIFCFLPLPPDVDCRTGLPVHIHGYFGLTDNRRGLTWPGMECQNNETAEWNKLLLTEIASVAFCKVLEALATNQPDTGINQAQRCQLVYATMPALRNVQGHWKSMLDPLFKLMITRPVFHALSKTGFSWVTINNSLVDLLLQSGTNREIHNIVLKVLGQYYAVVTNLPPHVLEIVKKFTPSSLLKFISPSVVRKVLKQSKGSVTEWSREEKLHLLTYVVSDGNAKDITGIPLLPLASKSFDSFRKHKHSSNPQASIFVSSGICPAELLPNMSARFLDEDLEEKVKNQLYKVTATKTSTLCPTQLVQLTSQIVLQNMRASLPSTWVNSNADKVLWQPGTSNHPPATWLQAIWNWINKSFPNTLASFEGLPLLPLRDNKLGILSRNSKFIFASEGTWTYLPDEVCHLLAACGCTVIKSLPSYVGCHKQINTYVAPPTASGLLSVLIRIPMADLLTPLALMTPENLSVLREVIARLVSPISDSERNLMLHLPLFQTIHGTITAAGHLEAVSENLDLPKEFQISKDRKLILATDDNVRKLLKLLKVRVLSHSDFLIRHVFPDIWASRCYDNQQITALMGWIFERIAILRSYSQNFPNELKKLPFVSTESGKRKRPNELYDPNDAVLRDILCGEENVFPFGFYATTESIAKLKSLGLKTKETLTANDLFKFAQMIASSTLSSPLIVKRVGALFTILNDKPSYLNDYSSRFTLQEDLGNLRWIPCATIRSPYYPNFVSWYNNPALLRPSEVFCWSKAPLVGSSMPTLAIDTDEVIQKAFGMTRDPPLSHVIKQLQNAITSWKAQPSCSLSTIEVAKFQEMLVTIYCYLSNFLSSDISNAVTEASLSDWIWHGEGFSQPESVALSTEFTIDLRPQLFLLAKELRSSTLTRFFVQHGVKVKFTDEDILGVLDSIQKKHTNSKQYNLTEVTQDLSLCCAILQWVVKDGNVLPDHLQEKVFVPVQSRSNVLVLEACKKCTFCDRDWLRKGGSELDVPGNYQVIHDSVSIEVARLLGVPGLSTCLLSAECMGFEQTGPHESITNRIKTILQEYTEGVGIFKELIQNADDAGAGVARFVVDWRNGPTEKLLSADMADSQGPALWAYNDASFSDLDFKNINKLAGATKVEEVGKIGRFGLGFNAVYHLTDVPSFISRQYFVLFDPNVNHIENHIPNKSRPGIRIDLGSNPRPLFAFEDQFQPFSGMFGCRMQMKDNIKFHFEGTLFRFPFRTSSEARNSEICTSVYSKEKVTRIVSSLKECSSLLLLFTQHVTQVELYEINDGSDPSDMKLLLSVSKAPAEMMRGSGNLSSVDPFIDVCSNWWRCMLEKSNSEVTTPYRSDRFEITTKVKKSTLLCTQTESKTNETWLVASCAGTGSSVYLAAEEGRSRGLLPCGGAAACLRSVSNSQSQSMANQLKVDVVEGEAFCFLPLSIPTGLPVHVNGYFAVTSNRRGIWERTTSDQQIEVRWNESLLQDALGNAYLQLLNDAKTLRSLDYTYYMLWPVYDAVQSTTWQILVRRVYADIVSHSLPLFCCDGKWLSIKEGYLLSDEVSKVPGIHEALKLLNRNVFALPPQVVSSFIKAGQQQAVHKSTLNMEVFLEQLFLPNVHTIPKTIRDPIICHVLDCILSERNKFSNLLKIYPCITCSRDGKKLAKPNDLINPYGSVASLYSSEDHRFPVGDYFLTNSRICALEQLGMVKDEISWSEICKRAKSIQTVATSSRNKALERARNLVKYLQENLEKLTPSDVSTVADLRSIEFLPFISECPDGYDLPWEGSKFGKERFFSPNDVFLPSDKNLVGSSCIIVDDSKESGCGNLGHNVRLLLGFSDRNPTVEQVVYQLDAAISVHDSGSVTTKTPKSLEAVCKRVYKFFEDFIQKVFFPRAGVTLRGPGKDKSEGESLLKQLTQRRWLLIQGHFVSTKQVAFYWSGNGAPYLYGLPFEYRGKCEKLFQMVELKGKFSCADFISALKSLKQAAEANPLKSEELKLALCFATELTDQDIEPSYIGDIPLPDSNNVLCFSRELTINLTFWLKDRGDARYVHKDIPPQLALDLGAKSLQNRRLKKYSSTIGSPFGQHEKLTDRLKAILKSYPCDSGILKELVQNADDAGATEIHFIYDKRKLPHENVLQNNAKEVQGPALCVYNDKPFSPDDLEGIQKLGIGSKTDDLEKTGQYGIGFNAVYHLTDCPSFLSNGDTLCFLDPHCRYAPEATPDFPGEQFQPIDDEFKEDFKDVLLGYLGEHFKLKQATMFRLPLRTIERSLESHISHTSLGNYKMQELLSKFQAESRKMLLFLNHVKKISLSEINDDGQFKETYSVVAELEDEDEAKRFGLSETVKKSKGLSTSDVEWYGITYPLTISDSNSSVETWLVHQCCGSQATRDSIPDGKKYGLFPRGGISALISPQNSTSGCQRRHVAYCFLPLPVYTDLPVHVNAHFALDSSRRNIWMDTDQSSPLTKWNNFLKMSVLAPAYATLIYEARRYLPFSQEVPDDTCKCSFKDELDVKRALLWYHQLFPKPSKESPWSILAFEVYRHMGSHNLQILPVVVADVKPDDPICQEKQEESSQHVTYRIRSWLTAQDSYFLEAKSQTKLDENRLNNLLLRMNFPLLVHSPITVYYWFKEAGITCNVLSPMSIINFLRSFAFPNSRCKVGKLPAQLKETNIREMLDLEVIIAYCQMEEQFAALLEGLPLLLTADGQLRAFGASNPVYRSKYSDLFPEKLSLFVHRQFVHSLPGIDDLPERRVMRLFTVKSLNGLLPGLFPADIKATSEHVSWKFPQNGPLSKKWFERLWNFLESHATSEITDTEMSLSVLGVWPVIPTTNDRLVTINNGTTVLDATQRSTDTAQSKQIRKILTKLDCPTLNTEITAKKSTPTSSAYSRFVSMFSTPNKALPTAEDHGIHVIDAYVAQPHNVQDVLKVLDFMRRTECLGSSKLTVEDVHTILRFFQDDLANLAALEAGMLKKLPFFIGIDGAYYSLSPYANYAVIPHGIPTAEIGNLQNRTRCLFLHPESAVAVSQLYQRLGINVELSFIEFYSNYIIPNFNIFRRENQIAYLTHIKGIFANSTCASFVCLLTESLCIPDEHGDLHYAKEFYDPRNEVFQTMLKNASRYFPPSPFNDSGWLEFLSDIGMKTTVEEDQFLEFCKEVARDACTSGDREVAIKASKVLVEYLFDNVYLHSEKLLCSLSSIKFVASEKVERNLLSLHRQFECNTAEDEPPFVQFFDAVPWKYHVLTWSSSQLLPSWAEPTSADLLRYLGVQEVPSVDSIVSHLQNLSCTLAEICRRDETLPQQSLLQKIVEAIYHALNEEITCRENKDISNCCSHECKTIGKRLESIPCVLVEEGKVMVTGDRLSFATEIGCIFNPFLHTVPRKYCAYEHLMKRLGATEQFTSFQFANVLKAIKEQCQSAQMNPNLIHKANMAMKLLFSSLLVEAHGGNKTKVDDVKELFLPSENGYLVKSCDLILKVPPSLRDALPSDVKVMFPLEKCDLPRDKEDEYIKALPHHLRPKLRETLFKEVLNPSCLNDKCIAYQDDIPCEFIKRYILIIKSSEFQAGVIRLLKHKKKSAELTEQEEDALSLFGTDRMEIVCMRDITVHFVDAKTEKPFGNTSSKLCHRSCYVVENNNSWRLLVKHSSQGQAQAIPLSSCINRISNWLLDDCERAISSMLLCQSPSQIHSVLDELNIAEDFADEELKLGEEVPVVFHYLLQQNPLFVFHNGEIVAYGVETAETEWMEFEETDCDEFDNVKYVLAKVLSRADESEADGSYDFTVEYFIDLGGERKKVSVLDLYKFVQNDALPNQTTDLVPFTGDTTKLPDTVDEARREIREALRKAWRLPHLLRRKVIRRLYLRWHPDKNPDNVEFATEMFEFLRSEINRMEAEESKLDESCVLIFTILRGQKIVYTPTCEDKFTRGDNFSCPHLLRRYENVFLNHMQPKKYYGDNSTDSKCTEN